MSYFYYYYYFQWKSLIVLDVVTKYEYYSRHGQLMSDLSLKRQQSKILEHFKASMK